MLMVPGGLPGAPRFGANASPRHRDAPQVFAQQKLVEDMERVEGDAHGALLVAMAPAVQDAGDGGLAVVPPAGGGALERHDEVLPRQDGQVGLEEHSPGRQVEHVRAHEFEVSLTDDLAAGPDRAAEASAGTVGMEYGAHRPIVTSAG